MKIELKTTEDHSHTLFVPELNEHYHSIHGAVQESQHVFIDAGLKPLLERSQLSILEVGFGTGLNAFMTYLNANGICAVKYTGVERYPVPSEVVHLLNYAEGMHADLSEWFLNMHRAPWNKACDLTSSFVLNKVHEDMRDFTTNERFDLVYFDAFAPDKQPDLWHEEVFHKIFKLMNPKAVLTTYCAKGSVRRNLQSLGLEVERLKGPPGKREMLRATKNR